MRKIRFDKDRYHLVDEMLTWGVERFGEYRSWHGAEQEPPAAWYANSMFGITDLYFRKDADFVLFALKWCSAKELYGI